MPTGPETHRGSSSFRPISLDGPRSHVIFPTQRIEDKGIGYNRVDPSVVIELLDLPSGDVVEGIPKLFAKSDRLTLWKDPRNNELLNYWLVLYPQIPQETQNFFQRLI